jgi:hypothetical protein
MAVAAHAFSYCEEKAKILLCPVWQGFGKRKFRAQRKRKGEAARFSLRIVHDDHRPLKKSKKQIPRGLKSARDKKNKGLRRGPEGPLYPGNASNRVFQRPGPTVTASGAFGRNASAKR